MKFEKSLRWKFSQLNSKTTVERKTMEIVWMFASLGAFLSFEVSLKLSRKNFHENSECASLTSEKILQWIFSQRFFPDRGPRGNHFQWKMWGREEKIIGGWKISEWERKWMWERKREFMRYSCGGKNTTDEFERKTTIEFLKVLSFS